MKDRESVRKAAALLTMALAVGGAASATDTRPRRFAPGSVPPPQFQDPERRTKLAAAIPELDRIFREFQEKDAAPGLVYGLIVDGELVHARAFGLRQVGPDAPATVDSVFRIASMTKSFTALAVLKLRDEGKLRLDDPVERHVPELRGLAYPTQDSPLLTIRHLLTHSEGFPEDNPWGDRQLAIPEATFSDWLRGGLPFSNAPGVAYEYSNYGFAILGRVVSRVSGMPRREYIDRRILRPLGMTSTKWEASAVPADWLAKGYRRDGEGWIEEPPLGDGAFGAMGGLFSSVPDLARYVAFFLSAWPPRDDPDPGPVARASLREMQQPARPYRATARRASPDGELLLNAGGYAYGLGSTQTCRFAQMLAHSGGLPGYGSQMRWLPEYGVGLVALVNRTYAGPGRPINAALEALHRAGGLQPRVTRPGPGLLSARDAVNRLLARWDDAAADALAADNLFLDRSRERRRQELDELRRRHGACHPEGAIQAENALRGEWRLACERGSIRVSITLAPTQPPRVQHLETTSLSPLGGALAAAASRLAAVIGSAQPAVAEWLAPGVDPAPLASTVAAASAWGACRLGDVESGGGESATVRLLCEKGELDARLALDAASGRLRSATLVPASGQTCVP